MKIIIEGPDGAGKSTLANLLSIKTGYPIIHRSNPKTDEEKKRMFDMYLQDAKSDLCMIYDRFLYSELVYGPIMRDTSCLNFEQMYEVEVELEKTGAIIIVCNNKITKLWEACLDRGETYIKSIDVLKEISNAYTMLFEDINHLIPVLHYRR